MNPTKVFNENVLAFNKGYRRIINMGGTSSSKTFSELELAFLIAQDRAKDGVLISVVSESLPHLKMGAIRDFEKILRREGMYNEKHINKTEHSYEFGHSIVEFFSADSQKAAGPRRNILILNECNNIPYSAIENLEIRTDETIFYDFNPTAEFWMEEKVYALPPDEWCLIKSNYLNNKHLSPVIIRDIENKARLNPNFKRIHVDVEYGNYEGLVFGAVPKQVCEFPKNCKWIIYGMDFGYSNDPTTLIKIGLSEGELYFEEMLYRVGMTNREINDTLKSIGIKSHDKIIADSSEPKSIRDLEDYGWNISGAVKGPDSIINGIDIIKQYKLNVINTSLHMIKEFRNYTWQFDKKQNRYINEPIDLYNHCIDAMRYGISNKLGLKSNEVGMIYG